MVATFKVREFTAITRQLETIRAELPERCFSFSRYRSASHI